MVDVSRVDPRIATMIAGLQERFPQIRITSGYRSPEYNASIGGAKSSQHLHGNAFDFSVRGLPEDQQRAALTYLREQGAQGFGYYPDTQSVHADIGSPRFWGPDRTSASLGKTPTFFQEFAGQQPVTQTASATQTAPAAAPVMYSPDPLTSLQRIGNAIAPSMVSAPTPLTPDQMLSSGLLGRQNSLLGGDLGKMGMSILQQQEAVRQAAAARINEDFGPGTQQGRFVPINFSRGLL